jgi:YD repeat-containing protein
MNAHRLTLCAASLVIALAFAAGSRVAGAAETQQHDAIGRLTDVTYADGGSIHYTYDPNGNLLSIVTSAGTTAVDGGDVPLEFALGPATPNPGAGPRSIAFSIPARGHVKLRVFDLSGREVASLYDRVLDPGRYTAKFSTARWGTGTYFYRLETTGHMRAGRMQVLK